MAYTHLQQRPADHIRALVVLTDGEDNASQESFNDLIRSIHADPETHTIHVFTIAYGHDAERKVL